MSQEREQMYNLLRQRVVPVLIERGFQGSFPNFRRRTEKRIHLITFQFDKWGGGFVIEIANCPPDGFTTSWGKHIEQSKVKSSDIPHSDRRRIQANMAALPNSSARDWFRYDGIARNLDDIYETICADVLDKLSYADDFWTSE